MTRQEAKIRIEKLRVEIDHQRYLYHVLDQQDISDAAHDSLKHELYKLEQQFPEFITSDSPTQRVGGAPLPEFKKVPHRTPMLSIEDVFNPEELRQWLERIKKVYPQGQYDAETGLSAGFFAEIKMDGLAVSLLYKQGVLVLGSTSAGTFFVAEASLSFLGLGIPPPAPSWGGMMSSDGRVYMLVAP